MKGSESTMAGSSEWASAKEIDSFLEKHHPEMLLISRKPTNSGAMVIHKKTGQIWLKGEKNYRIMEQLTDPNGPPPNHPGKDPIRLLNIPPTLDLKSEAENHAREVIGHFNELVELMGEPTKLVYDDKGRNKKYLKAIRYPTMDFTTDGRKER